MLKSAGWLLAAVSCTCAQASFAAPAAPPNALVSSTVTHSTVSPYSYHVDNYQGFTATNSDFAIIRAGAQPSPYIAATAIANAMGENTNIQSSIVYFLTVDAGDPNLTIPFIVSGKSALDAVIPDTNGSGVYAVSSLSIDDGQNNYGVNISHVYDKNNFRPTVGSLGNFDYINSFGATSRKTYRISLYTQVVAYGNALAYAYIDPIFSIDPTFQAAHPNASFSLSAGIGNEAAASALPESATWTLMIAGFGFVGGTMRRRKTSVVFA